MVRFLAFPKRTPANWFGLENTNFARSQNTRIDKSIFSFCNGPYRFGEARKDYTMLKAIIELLLSDAKNTINDFACMLYLRAAGNAIMDEYEAEQ